MKQEEIINIIVELGGHAVFNEICEKALSKDLAKECSIASEVQHTLYRLTNNDTLKRKLVEKNKITHAKQLQWYLE